MRFFSISTLSKRTLGPIKPPIQRAWSFPASAPTHMRFTFFWDVLQQQWVTCSMFQESRVVLHSRMEMSNDISTTNVEVAIPSQNLWHESISDVVPQPRRTETWNPVQFDYTMQGNWTKVCIVTIILLKWKQGRRALPKTIANLK